MGKRKEILSYEIVTVLSVVIFLVLMWLVTGKWPMNVNPYNSYALQADSWRQGRLDLGGDYSALELAIYQGKYYVSFPPFPSYVLFPLTFFFGSNTPDGIILFLVNCMAAICLYRLGIEMKLSGASAMTGTLLILLGSNAVFTELDPAVWFIAQSMCLCLASASLYFALKNKGGLSLACWACAVGCRPMQALFVPVLLVILYQNERKCRPESSMLRIMFSRWKWGIPAFVIALSYMILNYARFDSITEFGHNYLPEFVNAEYGQFHVHYIKDNLEMLFRIPKIPAGGRMVLSSMGNTSMLIVSPIFILYFIYIIYMLLKKEYKCCLKMVGILVLADIYMLIIVMHRTMGAWHFGNRYSNDILPWIYLGTTIASGRYGQLVKWQIPALIWGMCLNVVGSVAVYNGWV